jgi:hypothetical protein
VSVEDEALEGRVAAANGDDVRPVRHDVLQLDLEPQVA